MLYPNVSMPLVQPKQPPGATTSIFPPAVPTWTPPMFVPPGVLGGGTDSGFINKANMTNQSYVPPVQDTTTDMPAVDQNTIQAYVEPRSAPTKTGTVLNFAPIDQQQQAIKPPQQYSQQTDQVVTRDAPRATIMNPIIVPPAVSQDGNTQNYNTGIFSNVSQEIASGVNKTLEDSLSGKIFDPTAARLREEQAMRERTNRAATANRIAGAGFSGTGIGQQIGSATENEIAQNRFATEIGIEEAKNAARMGAVNTSMQFGQAQQGEASNALNQALLFGSDEDVGAAYEKAYGKKLDPAAVSEFRGAQRALRQQAVEAGAVNLAELKSTQAGKDFAAYVQSNLDSTVENDPALRNYAQKLWETSGNTGPVPTDWANARVAAVNDPRLTNQYIAASREIQGAVDSGVFTPEEGKLMQDFLAGSQVQFLKRDPTTGKVSFDFESFKKTYEDSTPSTVVNVNNGTAGSVSAPTEGVGSEVDDLFVGSDGQVYRNLGDGEIEKEPSEDITFEDIKKFNLGTKSTGYKRLFNNTDTLELDYKSKGMTDEWGADAPEKGETVKFKVGDKEILATVTKKGTQDVRLGFDNAYMEFEDLEGNKYYAGGTYKDGTVRPGTGDAQTVSGAGQILTDLSPVDDVVKAIGDPTIGNIAGAAVSLIPGVGVVKAGVSLWKKLFG